MTSSLGQRRFVLLILFLGRAVCAFACNTTSANHLHNPGRIKGSNRTPRMEKRSLFRLRPLSCQDEILRPDRLWQILLAEQLEDVDLDNASHRIERDYHGGVSERRFQIIGERI